MRNLLPKAEGLKYLSPYRFTLRDGGGTYLAPVKLEQARAELAQRFGSDLLSVTVTQQRARRKPCEVCGGVFVAKRNDAKRCSAACRQKAYRGRRNRGALGE